MDRHDEMLRINAALVRWYEELLDDAKFNRLLVEPRAVIAKAQAAIDRLTAQRATAPQRLVELQSKGGQLRKVQNQKFIAPTARRLKQMQDQCVKIRKQLEAEGVDVEALVRELQRSNV